MRAGWSFSLAAFMALNICSAVPPDALWVCVGFMIRFCAGSQLFFDSLRHSLPSLFAKHAHIRRNQGSAGGAVIDHDRSGVDVVEDSLAVFRQLRGRDVDFGRAHPEREAVVCAKAPHGSMAIRIARMMI